MKAVGLLGSDADHLFTCGDGQFLVGMFPEIAEGFGLTQNLEGGKRIDALGGVNMDIHTHIETNCVLLSSGGGKKQRRIAHVNGRTFIPLVMAPFYEHSMAALAALENHDFCVLVEVASAAGVCIEDVELWGNVYFLDTPERSYLVNNAHEFVTMQNQYLGPKTIRAGENRFPLNFDNIVGMVYFWGFDKTKVTNLKLMLNHTTYYDGDIEPLEYFKACQGYGDAEPCMIIFSQSSFGEPTLSTVNFSKMDNAELVITTTQTEESTVYIVGLSMQTVRMQSGMLGLAFSLQQTQLEMGHLVADHRPSVSHEFSSASASARLMSTQGLRLRFNQPYKI